MRTLLITNSYDVTSDILVRELGADKIIRINYDLIRDYNIQISATDIKISVADIFVSEEDISKCFWRKAFNGAEIYDKEFGSYHAAEYKYLLREIANIFWDKNKFVFNKYDIQNNFGKICQLRLAEKYFSIPNTSFIQQNNTYEVTDSRIIKSLASQPFDNGDVLYTTDVSNKQLAGQNPWLLQEKIIAKADVTVVYVYGFLYAYSFDRSLFEGLDWRQNIFEHADKWQSFKLSTFQSQQIIKFMAETNLTYGRLDFLLVDEDLIFLEVNANGQWAWLDKDRKDGLLKTIANCIDPKTPMPFIRQEG